jgi:hypothetical protein
MTSRASSIPPLIAILILSVGVSWQVHYKTNDPPRATGPEPEARRGRSLGGLLCAHVKFEQCERPVSIGLR